MKWYYIEVLITDDNNDIPQTSFKNMLVYSSAKSSITKQVKEYFWQYKLCADIDGITPLSYDEYEMFCQNVTIKLYENEQRRRI